MSKERKYQPSNGSEGDWFTEKFCMQCINCNPDPSGEKQCNILCASMCFNINDPEYPKEWIYNNEDKPTCTSWVKWDWGNDGDPDDTDNPKAPIPDDPNQLCMPFILEEIGENKKEVQDVI